MTPILIKSWKNIKFTSEQPIEQDNINIMS